MQQSLINFNKYTFRASGVSNLMTEPQGGSNMDKYLKAKETLEDKKSKLETKISDSKIKIESLKDGSAGRTKEEERLGKLNSELASLIASSLPEIHELEKVKDEINLSETTKSYLVSVYVTEKYNRFKEIDNKYTEKGKLVEELAIDFATEVHGKFYVNNKERRKNEFIEGECDIDYEEDDIVKDTKAAWSLHTYYANKSKDVKSNYYWQLICYMKLWGRSKGSIINVLINTPQGVINDLYKSALYSIGTDMKDTKLYSDMCAKIQRNNIFDDIPKEERVSESEIIEFNEEDYQKLVNRIIDCRKWLNQFAVKDYFNVYGKEALISKIGVATYDKIKYRFGFEEEPKVAGFPTQEETNLYVKEKVKSIESEIANVVLGEKETEILEKAEELFKESMTAVIETQEATVKDIVVEGFDITDVEIKESSIPNPGVMTRVFTDIKESLEHFGRNEEFEQPITPEEEEKFDDAATFAAEQEEDLKARIEECKSSEDCVALYHEIRDNFTEFPELKTLISTKRDGFLKTEEEARKESEKQKEEPKKKVNPPPPPPVAKKDVASQQEQVKSETPIQEGDITEQQIKDGVVLCKTGNEVIAYYKQHKDFINERPELKAFVTEIGKQRAVTPLS